MVLAYAWFNLAAAKLNQTKLSNVRDFLEKKLTPEERAEAQALSSNWKMGEVLIRKGK